MHPLLKKILSPLSSAVYQQELRNNTNIKLRLQARALDSTCEYVEEKLSQLVSVTSRELVLSKALSETKISGLYCEFGVFNGYTLNFIQSMVSETVHGFDSFKGLPEFWIDGFDKDSFKLPKTPNFSGNVEIHEGYYDESLPRFLKSNKETFAFMHVDCDLYSSTKTIFELCHNRIVPGTIISFDEYFNYAGWQHGEYKAFQEYVANHNRKYEYITYNAMHMQVAVRITQ